MASAVLKSINRVTVVLKHHGNDYSPKSASFLDCLVRYFEPSKHFVSVKCTLSDNLLTLCGPILESDTTNARSNAESCTSDVVILQHSPECPISILTDKDAEQIPKDVIDRGVAVGVSVILESADNRILMTRRASHLRTFPNAWVPPGGHIELNESLLKAGLRELEEETGINLTESSASIKILCLWESVYPLLLGIDLPIRHHIVVYLHARVNRPWKEIHEDIKLDPSEVQACTWLSPEIVKGLLTLKMESTGSHEMFVIQDDGSLISRPLDLKTMFHHLLWREGKVYSGSQLALHRWMDTVSKGSRQISKI